MAATGIESGGALARAIQSAVQPKLMEKGWVIEENDSTLSEYVTNMIVDGKDLNSIQAEMGTELLGVGEDDPEVAEFAKWLGEQVQVLSTQQQQSTAPTQNPSVQNGLHQQEAQSAAPAQDSEMGGATAPVDKAPTGPKSMRNATSGRGARGGRILGQLNKHLDRSQELPDNLRRIKGAAGGHIGRINAHSGRDGLPRGPKGANIAHGIQRMANGGARGAHSAMNTMNPMANPMMPAMPGAPGMSGMPMGDLNGNAQMQFMQMMEMQANFMAQLMQNGGAPMGGTNRGNFHGGQRGGRGGAHNNHKGRQQNPSQPQQAHAVNGRLPDGPLQPTPNTDTSMDIDNDTSRSNLFDTLCRFNLSCTNPSCGFAHQSPAAPPGTTVDLTDTCSFGINCANTKCSGRHPSPAQKSQQFKQEVDCKFSPNCTNPRCPFRHPTMCRNGADCTVPNCSFAHSKIMCRYNPCLNPACQFKHVEGQKRGNFEDKVWTAGDGNEGGNAAANNKSDRFADFSRQSEGQEEELIIPGRDSAAGQQPSGLSTEELNQEIIA